MDPEEHNMKQITNTEPVSPFWRNRLGVILLSIGCVCIFLYGIIPPGDFPKGESVFTITPGQSLKSVGTELKDRNYIRSRFLFATLVTLYGAEKEVPPGDYFISRPVTVFTLARQVAFGNHDLVPIKITVPEGDTATEIGTLLEQKIPGFDVQTFEGYATQHEGYLFPETYFIFSKTNPVDVVNEMRAMFNKKTDTLFTPAVFMNRSMSDIVIMASLVEREAHGSDDRAIIAGILWNRISRGMRLQVDATVAYAVGKEPGIPLTKADLAFDSPYNTYLHKGLPTWPISNPGLEALTAAVNPAQTSYLYYLHDKNGTIHYAKTYAEHLANIRKYL